MRKALNHAVPLDAKRKWGHRTLVSQTKKLVKLKEKKKLLEYKQLTKIC